MKELWIVTFIWAFSYSIIGQFISPFVDPYFAVLFRSSVGLLIFLPFIKMLKLRLGLTLIIIGALQFGVTYILLYQAYAYLSTPEILLFTITTPIFVTILNDILQKKFQMIAFISALIAVVGAFIIRYDQLTDNFFKGFILLQCANVTFACGQVYYRDTSKKMPHIAHHAFGYFFLGACLINLIAFVALGNKTRVPDLLVSAGVATTASTWLALIFVSVIATGLGQFLWCVGAKKVAGGTLAVMNNAVIPIGIIVNLIFWNKPTNYVSLTIGASIMLGALLLNFYPVPLSRSRQQVIQ